MRLYQLNGQGINFDLDYANEMNISSVQIIVGDDIIADFSLSERSYWALKEIKDCFITINVKINGIYFYYGKEWISNSSAEEVNSPEETNAGKINDATLPFSKPKDITTVPQDPPIKYDVKQKLMHIQNIMKGKLENVLR